MPFNSALTTPQLNNLRGVGITGTPRFDSQQYLSLSSNKVVFQALVNQTAFTASFASVDYDTVTVGAFGGIEVGMTVLLSSTSNARDAYFVGRVRKAPTATTLYINETSIDITNNDTIFVLNDYRIAQRLLRFASNTLFVDFDEVYSTPAPIIYNLASAYAGFASGTPEGYTVAFSAQAFTVASGATISSYAWTLPSGTTVTGGATNTASVTVRFDPSADEYWVKLVVTDSNAVTATRRIPVWSHNDTFPPATGFAGASIRGDLDTGFNASVNAFDEVSSALDNTLTCIWSVDRYNDTETALNGNVNFVGRLRREQTGGDGDVEFSTLPRDTQFEIEGHGSQLARLSAPLFEITDNSAPSEVGQITDLTAWRAMAYLLQVGSTYLTLHSLEFDSTSNGFRALGLVTQGASMLNAVNDIAQSINGGMEFAPDGASQIIRNQNYFDTPARNALTTVANWTETDVTGIGIDIEQIDLVGRVEASGGVYNSANGQVTPVLGIAPGVAQGDGEGTTQLTRQILLANVPSSAGQVELNQRAGYKFADANRDTALNMSLPDGYYFLVPSRRQWHTWAISTVTNNRGIAYTTATRWTLTSISHTANNDAGTREVTAVFEVETTGGPGQSVIYPPPTEISTALPAVPAFNVYPTLPDLQFSFPSLDPADLPAYIDTTGATATEVLSDGNTVAIATTSQLWILTDVKLSNTPPSTEVTPPFSADEDEITAFKWSGFGKDGYLLVYDSTNDRSRVWYATDVFAGSWTAGAWMDGRLSILLTTDIPGEVYVVNQDTGSATSTQYDFFGGNGELTSPYTISYTNSSGTCSPTYDAVNDRIDGCTPGAGTSVGITLSKSFASQTITALSASYTYNKTRATPGGGSDEVISISINGGIVDSDTLPSGTGSGSGSLSWVGSTTVTSIEFDGNARNNNSGDGSYFRLTALSYTIGTSAGDVTVSYSVDNGATFNPVVTVGASDGDAGASIIPLRNELLIGRSGQVEENITNGAGGATVDYGGAIPDAGVRASAIVVPRYQIGTTSTSNSTTTPEYILGSSTLDTGTSQIALYSVTNTGATFTDITPNRAADYGTVVSPNSITMPWRDGDKIAGVFDFNGTRALYVSTTSGVGFWDDVATVGDNADYVRMRKNDSNALDLYYVNDVLIHSPDFGTTRNSKITPNDDATDPLILVEVYDT